MVMETKNKTTKTYMIPVSILPRRGGVANDMGDFFVPDDARDKIVVASGLCKSRDDGDNEIVMAAYCPPGDMRLLLARKNSQGEWVPSTILLGGDDESNILRAEVKKLTGVDF